MKKFYKVILLVCMGIAIMPFAACEEVWSDVVFVASTSVNSECDFSASGFVATKIKGTATVNGVVKSTYSSTTLRSISVELLKPWTNIDLEVSDNKGNVKELIYSIQLEGVTAPEGKHVETNFSFSSEIATEKTANSWCTTEIANTYYYYAYGTNEKNIVLVAVVNNSTNAESDAATITISVSKTWDKGVATISNIPFKFSANFTAENGE